MNRNDFIKYYDSIVTTTVRWKRWHFTTHEQEDIAQKIRLEAFKSKLYRKDTNIIESHLRRLAISRCIDAIRTRIRRNKVIFIDPFELNKHGILFDPLGELFKQEQRNALEQCIAELGIPCQSIITAILQGHKHKEIAKQENLSISTISTRIARCMTQLKRIISRHPFFKKD